MIIDVLYLIQQCQVYC